MKRSSGVHGVIAEFAGSEELVEAVRSARRAGYTAVDAYSPFPIDGLDEALGAKRSSLPLFALLGGLLGACGAYFMLWYSAVIDWPWNIGGRPLHSWASFVPVTFELSVLAAATSIFVGVLVLCRFPRPYHPVFNAPGFERASRDRFFLCLEAGETLDLDATKRFLESLRPTRVGEVPL